MLGDDFNALPDELERRATLLEEKNATLTHQATHDGLAGLPNRACFEQRLQDALRAAQRERALVALLFLDSDRFKQVNDTHGHAAGDAMLAAVARRISLQLRAGDLAARLGGDEFAIVVASLRDPQDALRLAHRAIAAMDEPVPLPDGTCLRPSVSIGIALYPEHGGDMASLLRAADAAMYHVKARRRGHRHMAAGRGLPTTA